MKITNPKTGKVIGYAVHNLLEFSIGDTRITVAGADYGVSIDFPDVGKHLVTVKNGEMSHDEPELEEKEKNGEEEKDESDEGEQKDSEEKPDEDSEEKDDGEAENDDGEDEGDSEEESDSKEEENDEDDKETEPKEKERKYTKKV